MQQISCLIQEAQRSAAGADDAEDYHEVDDMDAEFLVGETFRRLFPESFQHVMPIRNHKSVDLLLMSWDKACARLERAEAAYEKIGGVKRPTHRLRCCGSIEPEVDSINFWAERVRTLEAQIVEERQRVLQSPPCGAFFVFFNNQRDAAIAAQVNLHPEDGHSFRVQEAPGPEEVCWTTLWRDWRTREIRELIALPFIVIMMLVPVGLFTGAVAQLTVAICGSSGIFNTFYSDWYCASDSTWRSLVTGSLPPILLTLWQALVMPNAFYRLAIIESQSVSLSGLDRRIATLFVFWDVFNVFLGGMFAGSAFSQLGVIINKPGSIPTVIGTALPASSNFFINTLILKAFTMMPLRMFFPHIGALSALFQAMGCCTPKSERDRFMTLSPHSIRHGREVGSMMLVFVIALAYASSSPLILVFALAYFFASWIMWRHHLLYIYERCYESGGLMWDKIFDYMMWSLFILEFFTACVLLANAAFVQMSILLATMTPFLWKFNRYCKVRYAHAVRHMPLETAANAPSAHIDPFIYMPPALRSRAQGWYPECGKAWETWGMPAYTF
ncbi:hypothetical protein WJX84_009179 [Apatococcus fuscideae]|uniref:CSC1/OSCA1-like 7TM region domain-containing protein n=1 Tax=Apatococcus fuscideae TaxID=2026836 RepID=A0AAW1T455_9CHLO